jgi:hypothetical protein
MDSVLRTGRPAQIHFREIPRARLLKQHETRGKRRVFQAVLRLSTSVRLAIP